MTQLHFRITGRQRLVLHQLKRLHSLHSPRRSSLARRPRRLRRSRGRRLPLRSSPSRSFLFPAPWTPARGGAQRRRTGEAVTGPADRTPTPGVHHPPGSRPAQASPLSTRTPRPKLRLLSARATRCRQSSGPRFLQIPTQRPKVPGSRSFLQIPASTAPPGSRHGCPPP